jgi:hypothetical protein
MGLFYNLIVGGSTIAHLALGLADLPGCAVGFDVSLN